MDVSAKGPLQQLAARFDYEIEKVSGSRFIATLSPAANAEAVVALQGELRAAHPHSRHVCFAYVGETDLVTRFSDDGEPGKTAGLPMLRVLLGSSLRNTGALVTRYFGGTKLGTGGLVRAYTAAVREAIDHATLQPLVHVQSRVLECSYALEPKVRHWAAHHTLTLDVLEYRAASVRVSVQGEANHLEAFLVKLREETEIGV